jgi:broad specificity phosphatase PhoE
MAAHLYLLRHGATEWSELGKHTSRTDLPLVALGEQQATAWRHHLSSHAFARVLTSPLQRARRTAELAGFTNATVEPRLAEVDYGRDEGRTRDQIRAERPGWDFFTSGGDGGESLDHVATRARSLIDELAGVSGDVLLVSHGHFLRIFTATYLGAAPAWGGHLAIGAASLSILGDEHGVNAIANWNLSAPTGPT